MSSKIFLTGATGFIGRRLATALNSKTKVDLTAVVRNRTAIQATNVLEVESIDANTDWSRHLINQKTVIHLAARAHVANNDDVDPLARYRRVNVDGAVNLFRQAAAAGVQRFIFVSSIGVNGQNSSRPFTEEDEANPSDLYAQSKFEAEKGLWDVQNETGIELVIIRPPLVYGPQAPGNFGSLVRWVESGIPLPLGAIHNKRSLVALDNLVDLVLTCIDHPAARNQLFLAGDGQDLSTTDLLTGVARAMGRQCRLIPIPEQALMLGARLAGKENVAKKLLGSLQVDISKARSILGWEPPISVEEGLIRCFEPEFK